MRLRSGGCGFRLPATRAGWCLLLCAAVAARSQNVRDASPPGSMPADPRGSALLCELREALPRGAADITAGDIQRFADRGLKLRGDGKVFVELIGPTGAQARRDLAGPALPGLDVELGLDSLETLHAAPGDAPALQIPLSCFANRAEAWIPLARLEAVAAALPEAYRIQPVVPLCLDPVAGQGPHVMNSESYTNAGHIGSGLTIALFDYGFEDFTAAQTNGDAPATYVQRNFTGDPFEDGGTHGTRCVEAAFDHCPGATWRIYKVDSPTDMGPVVSECIAQDVEVISMSVSWYNQGWQDDTGPACAAANAASSNNILFVTSAGNRAESHYQGTFTDTDGDGWHEFAPGDESINITVSTNLGTGHYLAWNNMSTDLDFVLFTSPTGSGVAAVGSLHDQGEMITYGHTGADATYSLRVRHGSGPTNVQLEIFSHNSAWWLEHTVAANSTTSPSNAGGSNVLSIGAVTFSWYSFGAGSAVIESYSSRGPSNSGMTLPDVCGATGVGCFTFPNFIDGTSGATPNVAGAACAFWSSDPQLSAHAVAWLLKEQAVLLRDWGTAGNDNTYGKGGVYLVDYHYGTRWAARSYPGTRDHSSVPYHTILAAYNAVPDNGRLLVFGEDYGTFPEPADLGLDSKTLEMVVVSNSAPAILGE